MSIVRPTGYSGSQIYSMAVNSRGIASLDSAASGSAVNSDHCGSLSEELRRSSADLASAWTGTAAEAAGHSAEPISRRLNELQSTYAQARDSLRNQVDAFTQFKNSVMPMPSAPPQTDWVDDLTPWDTDTEKAVRTYHDAEATNQAAYRTYLAATAANQAALPTMTGPPADAHTADTGVHGPGGAAVAATTSPAPKPTGATATTTDATTTDATTTAAANRAPDGTGAGAPPALAGTGPGDGSAAPGQVAGPVGGGTGPGADRTVAQTAPTTRPGVREKSPGAGELARRTPGAHLEPSPPSMTSAVAPGTSAGRLRPGVPGTGSGTPNVAGPANRAPSPAVRPGAAGSTTLGSSVSRATPGAPVARGANAGGVLPPGSARSEGDEDGEHRPSPYLVADENAIVGELPMTVPPVIGED